MTLSVVPQRSHPAPGTLALVAPISSRVRNLRGSVLLVIGSLGPLCSYVAMPVSTSGIRQPSIWASVVSDDALRLRNWLLGLGFTEDLMIPGEREGLVHHCQLDWPEGGRVLLSSSGERSTPCKPGTSSLHVVTSDPDAVMQRALSVGATVVYPLVDQTDYPSRDCTVADPDGNYWTFATFAG